MTKKYYVNVGLDFVDANADRYTSTQLIRDGRAIGMMDFKNGSCYRSLVIDGLEREWSIYFMDESQSLIKNSQPSFVACAKYR